MNKWTRAVERVLLGSVLGLCFVTAWEAAAAVSPDRFLLVTKPSVIAVSLPKYYWGGSEPIFRHALITLEEVSTGMVVGVAAGLLVALAMYSSIAMRSLLGPPLIAWNSIPHVALAPLSILWFGFGLTGKVVLVALILTPLFALNMYSAMRATAPEWLAHVRVLGASPLRLVGLVLLPASLPTLLTTLRYAVGNSFRIVIFAEFIGSSGGLGYLLILYGNQVEMKGLFAIVLLVVGISFVLDFAPQAAQNRLVTWQRV